MDMLTEPQVRSWQSLMQAYRTVAQNLESALLKADCSLSRFQILYLLYFEGASPASVLVRKLGVTRGNISTFLKRMLIDGLVKVDVSVGSPSRPFYILSDHGQSYFESIFPEHIAQIKGEMPALSDTALQLLADISKRSN